MTSDLRLPHNRTSHIDTAFFLNWFLCLKTKLDVQGGDEKEKRKSRKRGKQEAKESLVHSWNVDGKSEDIKTNGLKVEDYKTGCRSGLGVVYVCARTQG